MRVPRSAMIWLFISAMFVGNCQGGFFDVFYVLYGPENIKPNDATGEVQIGLTTNGMGATFTTNSTYMYGSFSVQMKLVPGNSAGTVAAFFLISNTPNHDEIDFEFLGNETGKPYLLHTNLFANGVGEREMDIFLWFDPTIEYHLYQVVWNHKQVLWLVDGIPIRVHQNIENVARNTFPHSRPMVVSSCIFDASSWATQGGRIPINYTDAPFEVMFKDFSLDACKAAGNQVGSCDKNYSGNWWEASKYQTFGTDWVNQLAWVRAHYLQYDYCEDPVRYPKPPLECRYNNALGKGTSIGS